MPLEQELIKRLRALKDERKLSALSESAGVEQSNLSKALGKSKQKLGLDKVSKILDAMGAKVFFPDQCMPEINTSQHDAIGDEIISLRKQLADKDRKLAELLQYKHRWEGLLEIRRMEADVKAQAREMEFSKKKREDELFSNEYVVTHVAEGNCSERQKEQPAKPDDWLPPDT